MSKEAFEKETGWKLKEPNGLGKVYAQSPKHPKEADFDESTYWKAYSEWLEKQLEEAREVIMAAKEYAERKQNLSNHCQVLLGILNQLNKE